MLARRHLLVAIGYLEGMKNYEIAEALAMEKESVSHILRREDVKEYITEKTEKRVDAAIDNTTSVRKRYNDVVMEAVEEQIALMRQGEDPRTKAQAIKDIIAGSGFISEREKLRVAAIAQARQNEVPKLVIIDRRFTEDQTQMVSAKAQVVEECEEKGDAQDGTAQTGTG